MSGDRSQEDPPKGGARFVLGGKGFFTFSVGPSARQNSFSDNLLTEGESEFVILKPNNRVLAYRKSDGPAFEGIGAQLADLNKVTTTLVGPDGSTIDVLNGSALYNYQIIPHRDLFGVPNSQWAVVYDMDALEQAVMGRDEFQPFSEETVLDSGSSWNLKAEALLNAQARLPVVSLIGARDKTIASLQLEAEGIADIIGRRGTGNVGLNLNYNPFYKSRSKAMADHFNLSAFVGTGSTHPDIKGDILGKAGIHVPLNKKGLYIDTQASMSAGGPDRVQLELGVPVGDNATIKAGVRYWPMQESSVVNTIVTETSQHFIRYTGSLDPDAYDEAFPDLPVFTQGQWEGRGDVARIDKTTRATNMFQKNSGDMVQLYVGATLDFTKDNDGPKCPSWR